METNQHIPTMQPSMALPEAEGIMILQNRTAKRLRIEGDEPHVLVLAPLEEREVAAELLAPFDLTDLKRQGLLAEQEKKAANRNELIESLVTKVFVGIGFWVVMGLSISSEYPKFAWWYWIGGLGVFVLIGAGILVFSRKEWPVVVQGAAQTFSLLLILIFGVGGPLATLYHFGDGRALLEQGPSLALLGRVLQYSFIVAASLLPALLYYLFDRYQLGTLRQRFYREIFRLDPNVETLNDVRARYGKQIREIYGSVGGAGEGRLLRDSRWPLIVTTLVVTLGWILTLGLSMTVDEPVDALLDLFVPHQSTLTFGFLGAYFFGLNLILRRYLRGDLRPKAYSHITARIFVVIILTWTLAPILPAHQPAALLTAFVIGVFPETGWIFIREFLQTMRFGAFIPTLQEDLPLTALEEIDVYDRARLFEEGVTNIESLAHHELIDLILETRIPVPRLVDWMDQAILYLHLKVEPDDDEALRRSRERLRRYGIRTATDLERGYRAARKRTKQDPMEPVRFLSLLEPDDHAQPADGRGPYRVQLLLDTIAHADWLDYVRQWRASARVKELRLCAPAHPRRRRRPAGEETPLPAPSTRPPSLSPRP